jgi:uncharacterized DUF497 family protein
VSATDYEFDWDDNKAAINLGKHGVDFREAMTVILDPLAMTFFDAEHSQDEERWISVGRSGEGALLLMVHTFTATGPSSALVRIISARAARAATRNERRQYEQVTLQ